jgi:hypothetical protein
MASMLLDENFVAVFPSLVRRLGGMNEAAVLQTIHFHFQINRKESGGQQWTPLTCAEIGKATGLSEDAVFRSIGALRKGLVLIGTQAQAGSRKLMWRIDYEVLDGNPNRENAESKPAQSRKGNREIAESTTTKNTKEVNNIISTIDLNAGRFVKQFVDDFNRIHGTTPDKSSIGRIGRDAKRMLTEGREADLIAQAILDCATKGHANLPSALTALLAKAKTEPKGFAGIREFLESGDPNDPN